MNEFGHIGAMRTLGGSGARGDLNVMGEPAADETWTVGEAARFLNGGGVDFGITPKRVRFMAKDPECGITAVSGGAQKPGGRYTWHRIIASSVRAERARLLAQAGREDPEWPVPQVAG